METSQNYADTLEPGLRKKKKKKKMERGEVSMYDSGKAEEAQNRADREMNRMMRRKTGVKY